MFFFSLQEPEGSDIYIQFHPISGEWLCVRAIQHTAPNQTATLCKRRLSFSSTCFPPLSPPLSPYSAFPPVVDNDEEILVKFGSYMGNMITLSQDESQILVGCEGPHILHVEVCVSLLDQSESRGDGTLTLRVNNQPKVSFPLNATQKALSLIPTGEACVGQQQIMYLHKREIVTVYFHLTNLQAKLKLGLHYLLGQCQF